MKAVIYSRVSTSIQNYEGQTLDLNKYAAYKGLEIVETFEEKVSGYNEDIQREEYERMKSYVIENNIKNILCWEISRFSRKTHIALKEIEFFTKHGVNIFFKKEEISSLSDNAFNKVLLTLLASIAQMEKETMKARHHRGMIKGASQGKAHGLGILPFGYRKDESGNLQIDVEESKWVRQMYEWRASGKSMKWIATALNKKEIKTRRNKNGQKRILRTGEIIEIEWRSNSVQKILKSKLYKGIREYMGETFTIPYIIDDDLWNKVQVTFENNIGYVNRTVYKYLFKGKVFCGKCKLSYFARTDLQPDGYQAYYFCSGRKDTQIRCRNGQFKASTLDKFAWDMLSTMAEFRENVVKEREKIDKNEALKEIKYLKELIQKSDSRKNRIVNAYLDGNLNEELYKRELDKIKTENADAEKEIKELTSQIKRQDTALKSLEKAKIHNIRWSPWSVRRRRVEEWVDKVYLTHYDGDIEGSHGNDQKMLMELYAFGLQTPQRALITSVSEICITI